MTQMATFGSGAACAVAAAPAFLVGVPLSRWPTRVHATTIVVVSTDSIIISAAAA